MATHQEIGGFTDADMLQRMVTSHPERYAEAFWEFFDRQVGVQLPPRPVIVDVGCGPGLFLRDLGVRYPQAVLYGYDITPAMVDYARELAYPGPRPSLAVHDLTAQPLPLDTGSVHLVCMTAVLHVLDEPLPVLGEVRRLLAPSGVFLLHDWIRISLQEYLTSRPQGTEEALAAGRSRWFRLFPVHNKYTEEDWRWLLAEAGFTIRCSAQVRPHFRLFVAQS